MKQFMKRCLSLLLVIVLLAACSGCVSTYVAYLLGMRASGANPARAEATPPPVRTPPAVRTPPDKTPETIDASPDVPRPRVGTHFSDMVFQPPDTDAISAEAEALLADVEDGFDPDTWLPRYEALLARYNDAIGQNALAYVYYAFDVTEDMYEAEYERLNLFSLDIDVTLTDLTIAILESEEKGAEALSLWGQDYADTAYLSDILNSDDVQPLFEREIALELDYDEMLTTYLYKEDGKTWTLDDIAAAYGSLEYEEYVRLYDAYCAGFNKEAGALFLELLDVRNQIAQALDYDNFAEYRYSCYSRDFTLEEAQTLHAVVKEEIVPLYYDILIAYYYSLLGLEDQTFDLDTYLDTLKETAEAFSPRLSESLTFMLENGLYDFEPDDNKMEGSFTIFLDSYGCPFIFSQWGGTSSDVSTIIHELGHFTHGYFSPENGWGDGYSLDLAEVDSQGLEMLMLEHADRFYGSNARMAKVERLLDGLNSILAGCMEDEFQQRVYAQPDMTLNEINALYKKLADEYGFTDLYGYKGTYWTLVQHTFQSPMYYISYAVSQIMALQLWAEGETDYEAACDAYWRIIDRDSYDSCRETAAACGMADPLDPECLRTLADLLRKALDA